MTYTSHARLQAAINHRESDRIPFDLGSTKMTGISAIAYKHYLQYKDAAYLDPEPSILDIMQQLAKPSEAFLRALDVDVRGIFPAPPDSWQASIIAKGDSDYLTDEWGIMWRKPKQHGLYFDLNESPMVAEDLDQNVLNTFPWPDPGNQRRYASLQQQLDQINTTERYGITLHGMTSGALEMALRLRGFENFFVDLIADSHTALILINKIVDIKIAYWTRALAMIGHAIDVAVEVDDLGTQESLLLSPEIYRTLVKPCHKRLFAAIKKSAPHIKVFFHSCGAIAPLMDDLIEIGVDIINPVQFSASGMNVRELKQNYGKDIVFWGGVIDTQKTLPYGSPDQIKDEVKRNIETLAPGGGYVINTVHNIQSDVPPQNLDALFEAINTYR